MVHQLFALVNALKLKSILDLVPKTWVPPEPLLELKVSGSTLSPQQQLAVESMCLPWPYAEDLVCEGVRHDSKLAQKQKARAAAQALLTQHGVKAAPVPIERIVKSCRVRVEYAPLDSELSGLAHIRDDVPIVGINTLHAPTRQRFTLAHELAHVQLHRREA